MKGKLINKALPFFLGRFIENIQPSSFSDSNEINQLIQHNLLFKPDSLFSLGFRFLIESSTIQTFEFSSNSSDTLKLLFSRVEISLKPLTPSTIPQKSNLIFNDLHIKNLLKSLKLSVIFENVVIHLPSTAKIQIDSILFDSNPSINDDSSISLPFKFQFNNFNLHFDSKIILKSNFELKLFLSRKQSISIFIQAQEIRFMITNNIFHLFDFLKDIVDSMKIHPNIQDLDSSINYTIEGNAIQIQFEDYPNNEFQFQQFRFENKVFHADQFQIHTKGISSSMNSILTLVDFTFNFQNYNIEIKSIQNDQTIRFKQINKSDLFLQTVVKESNFSYLASGIEYEGDFGDLLTWTASQIRIIEFIFSEFRTHINVFQNEEKKSSFTKSLTVHFPFISLKLNSGFIFQFDFHIIFSLIKTQYFQLLFSDISLSYQMNEPIFQKTVCQLLIKEDSIEVFLSPSDTKCTANELALIVHHFPRHISQLINQLRSQSHRHTITINLVTFHFTLCNEDLNQNKNEFLLLSSSDMLITCSIQKETLMMNLKCCPLVRIWNSKTSFWDYLINPFKIETTLYFDNDHYHFDVITISSLQVNLTPTMLQTLINRSKEIDLSMKSFSNLSKKSEYNNHNIYFYNGLSAPIPVSISRVQARTSSTPNFYSSNNSFNFNTIPTKDQNENQSSEALNISNDTIVINPNEIQLLESAKVDTSLTFPSLNITLRPDFIKDEYFIHNEIIVSPFAYKNGKLICLLPKIRIENLTGTPIKLAIFKEAKEKVRIKDCEMHFIKPNQTLPVNEVQCHKNFSIVSEKFNSSEMKFITMKYKTMNMYQENEIIYCDSFFSIPSIPQVFYSVQHKCKQSYSLCFNRQTHSIFNSKLIKTLQIRNLFAVTNRLPFNLICSFVSKNYNDIKTIEVVSNSTQDLNDFTSSVLSLELTLCIHGIGISKTVQTKLCKNPTHKQNYLYLQNEIITFPNSSIEICMTYCRNEFTGQFIFIFYSPIVISNKTSIDHLYIQHMSSYYQFSKLCTFSSLNHHFSISNEMNHSFVSLPQMSQLISFSIDKFISIPIYIKYIKYDDYVCLYELHPLIEISNDLDCDLKLFSKTANFELFIPKRSTKIITAFPNDFTLSVSIDTFPEIDGFVFDLPVSTVFRCENGHDTKIIHFQIDKNYSIGNYKAKFEYAFIYSNFPSKFVVVNNIPDFPVFVQQTEKTLPILVKPKSSILFPFDSPFALPVIMVTVSGKSQLIPLNLELKATQLPFHLGINSIYADLIVLPGQNGNLVQALIVGYHPFSILITKSSKILNPDISMLNFSFSIAINEILISLIDTNNEEFLNVATKNVKMELLMNSFNFSIDSIQIDDQIGSTVIMKSNSNNQMVNQNEIQNSSSNNSFITMSIKFNFNFNNLQSFALLVQPFDIQFDPAVISDVMCYFYNLFNEIKFKLRDRIVCFQTFNIYPIIINISCKNIPKRTFHFVLNETFQHGFNINSPFPDLIKISNLETKHSPSNSPDRPNLTSKIQSNNLKTPQPSKSKGFNHSSPIQSSSPSQKPSTFNSTNSNTVSQIPTKTSTFNDLNSDTDLNLDDNYIYFNCDNMSIWKNILIQGFSEKRCCIGFSSITLNDVNMRLAALIDILASHFNYFSKSAIQYITGLTYHETPNTIVSRFGASLSTIEFYRPTNQINLFKNPEIKQSTEKGDGELNLSIYCNCNTRVNLKTYLGLNGRLAQLTSIEVYPLISSNINSIIEYRNSNLIIPDLSLQNNHEILYLSPMNQIDSSFNDKYNLGQIISKQKKFISKKIAPLTNDQINLHAIIQKFYCHDNEAVRFLDYSKATGTIVALTDSSLDLFSVPHFNLLMKYSLNNFTDVSVNKYQVLIKLKQLKKFKNKNLIVIDFHDEEIANQLKLILKTLLIKHNIYVI